MEINVEYCGGILNFYIPHPLVVGFPIVPSPWGEGQGEGIKR